jgi:antirestriction protein ArdC
VSTDTNKSKIAEAVATASEQLVAALKAGQTEVLKRYLEAMGRFRKYSFTNCMLIFCQKPDATRVAGFHTWKSLGRHVKKGERGVMIMAPMVRTKRAKSGSKVVSIDADPETYITFRPVYVFDQDQTEGDALPDLRSNRVEGDATVYLERLTKHIADSGIVLEFGDPTMGADGRSYGGKIVIKAGMPGAETLSVLVHELSHERLHKGDRRKNTTKTVRETEAEAVAHVVCSSLGFATNGASETYIALYEGDADLLMASLSLIQKTATDILVAIADPAAEQETNDASLQELAAPLPIAA